MQRLPYVEKVEFENKPVAGSADLVDVDFNIKEGLPGQFGGGIGYSEAQKFSLNGNFVHSNFMGTGERIALGSQRRLLQQDLYLRGHRSVHHRRRRRAHLVFDAAATSHSSWRHPRRSRPSRSPARCSCSYPITEYQYLSIGLSANKNEPGGLAGLQLAAVDRLGQAQRQAPSQRDLDDTNGDGVINSLDSPYTVYGTDFYTYELTGGWNLRCAATARCSPTAA